MRGPVDPFEEISEIIRRTTEKKKSEVDEYFEQAISKSKEPVKSTRTIDYAAAADKYRAIKTTEFQEPTLITNEVKKVTYKVNKRADDIRKKLSDPNKIRELILINEILNKPKALRHDSGYF